MSPPMGRNDSWPGSPNSFFGSGNVRGLRGSVYRGGSGRGEGLCACVCRGRGVSAGSRLSGGFNGRMAFSGSLARGRLSGLLSAGGGVWLGVTSKFQRNRAIRGRVITI